MNCRLRAMLKILHQSTERRVCLYRSRRPSVHCISNYITLELKLAQQVAHMGNSLLSPHLHFGFSHNSQRRFHDGANALLLRDWRQSKTDSIVSLDILPSFYNLLHLYNTRDFIETSLMKIKAFFLTVCSGKTEDCTDIPVQMWALFRYNLSALWESRWKAIDHSSLPVLALRSSCWRYRLNPKWASGCDIITVVMLPESLSATLQFCKNTMNNNQKGNCLPQHPRGGRLKYLQWPLEAEALYERSPNNTRAIHKSAFSLLTAKAAQLY